MARLPRSSFVAGVRAALPLALPVAPVGLVLGFLITETEAVSRLAGWSSGPLVMGGASQLAAVTLLGSGAGVVTTATTIAVINARHVMYSARLQATFRTLPLWFRLLAPYVLFDQVFALAELAAADDRVGDGERDRPPDEGRLMAHYLGTGSAMASLWWAAVAAGLVFGSVIPSAWSLDFAIPLLFLGLLVLSIANGPGVIAAVVGGFVAVAAAGLPNGSGLLVGAVAGIVAGGIADLLQERAGPLPGLRRSSSPGSGR